MTDITHRIGGVIARICGLLVLLAGLWISWIVFTMILEIYENPAVIDKWAIEIEQRSNLDRAITPLRRGLTQTDDGKPVPRSESTDLRLTYFVAWIFVLLLLLLLARIGLLAVKTGGELLLYDSQVKHLAREIIHLSQRR